MIYLIIIILFFIIATYKYIFRYNNNVTCLVDKVVLITGGCSGIGYGTALIFGSRGCKVIIADINPSEEIIEDIKKRTKNNNIFLRYLDLSSIESIRNFAENIIETEERLDILINNAGVYPEKDELSEDGLNKTMQINCFGHFLLTHLLVGLLMRSAPSRIVFISSLTAFMGNLDLKNINDISNNEAVSLFRIYSNSKLCNIMIAYSFAKRLKQFGIISNSVDPGIVLTSLFAPTLHSCSTMLRIFLEVLLRFGTMLIGKGTCDAAQTIFDVVTSDETQNISGEHFFNCRVFIKPASAKNRKLCEKLWFLCEEYVKLQSHEKLS